MIAGVGKCYSEKQDCERWAETFAETYAPSAYNHTLAILKHTFERAIEWGCATTILNSAIVDGIVRTQERYCFAEVCTCVFNGDPYDDGSTWHVVVCEIADDGKISFVFNPDQHDQRQHSLEQFPAVGKMFFVKANS